MNETATAPAPPINWRRIEEHPNEFGDGDTYLVSLRVRNNRTKRWRVEVYTVMIEADEGRFGLLDENGERFYAWDWSDFEWWANPNMLTPDS